MSTVLLITISPTPLAFPRAINCRDFLIPRSNSSSGGAEFSSPTLITITLAIGRQSLGQISTMRALHRGNEIKICEKGWERVGG
ncbi:hypothetical protein PoB_002933600 [Plakobranchus ocellatus]|uniref:Uncharacterized protein n=1 Tax=Plakobranchus ocellatus TaxID=259542 RepID=A0AAV3ZV31_9GAST|nr:hypothetical protein PoB_002933600 [Plakobranchus ocellatus]